MPSKLANLKHKAEHASKTRVPLKMDPELSLDLRDKLLEINKIAMLLFDVLDMDMISQADIFTIIQLPELVNHVTFEMQKHAKERINSGR